MQITTIVANTTATICPYPPSSCSWTFRKNSCSSQFGPEIHPLISSNYPGLLFLRYLDIFQTIIFLIYHTQSSLKRFGNTIETFDCNIYICKRILRTCVSVPAHATFSRMAYEEVVLALARFHAVVAVGAFRADWKRDRLSLIQFTKKPWMKLLKHFLLSVHLVPAHPGAHRQ